VGLWLAPRREGLQWVTSCALAGAALLLVFGVGVVTICRWVWG
jgi:hypothetical protein